jgi:diphthamide synthase (EF-2-diphthine--ammonia ligase)
MSWAALTSGGKDLILSCQKAIDSGKEVKYMVTACPKNLHSYVFHSANLDVVPVIARVAGMQYHWINLAGEGAEYESITLNAPFYSWPITFSTSQIRSTPDRREQIPGGFA